jgi:tRNA threonylcarbamoyladenosine biosynthesis protein TsaB
VTDPVVLAIETAGSGCSVAVARGSRLLAQETRALRHGHAEMLLPMVERVVAAAGLPRTALEIVAVAVGPGGFTGIRLGIAAARGIALALGAGLIGVTGFAAVAAGPAAGIAAAAAAGTALLVALDSRRADLYVQLFLLPAAVPLAAPAAVLPEALPDHVAAIAGTRPLLIAGDAAAAAATALLHRPCCAVIPDSAPDAPGVLAAALQQAAQGSAAVVRPLYLRPPDVTLPKPRGTATPAAP